MSEFEQKQPILHLGNVSSELGSGYLHNLTLDIHRGDNCIIFGPESCGIDALVTHILGIDESYSGDIQYKDYVVKELDYDQKHSFKKEIGYMHREFGLISNMTVFQNISLPLEYHSEYNEDTIKTKVLGLMDELNLEASKNLRPIDLTSSEILRAAFARSIILDPDLLLLQYVFEAQSPLNIQSFVTKLKIRASNPDKTILLMTYEPEKFIDLASRFVMFYNGRVVFDGSRDEFLYNPNEYVDQYINVKEDGPMIML